MQRQQQAPVKDVEMKIAMPRSFDLSSHLHCSISLQLFFEPVCVSPCNHVFERYLIRSVKNKKCPECKMKIQDFIDPPPALTATLEAVLQAQPQLQKNRFFHPFYLYKRENENADDYAKRFQYICNFLLLSGFDINTIDQKNGSSIIACLACSEEGRAFLKAHPEFFAKISSEGLNTIDKDDGTSAVYWFADDEDLAKLLLEDPVLCGKISSEALNAVHQDEGDSAVSLLLANPHTRKQLIKNPELCAKITAASLNAINKKDGSSELLKFVSSEEDIESLLKNPDLCAKITASGLNAIDKITGESVAYRLISSHVGHRWLLEHPEFYAKFTWQSLNAISKEDGCSAVTWLTVSPEDLLILGHHQITQESFNSIHKETGSSAVYFLAKNCCALLGTARFRQLITAAGINTTIHDDPDLPDGDHALYQLSRTKQGRAILLQDEKLIEMIAPELWHNIPKGEQYSAAWNFLNTEDGKELLAKHPLLREKVNRQEKMAVNDEKRPAELAIQAIDPRSASPKRQKVDSLGGANPRGLFALPEQKKKDDAQQNALNNGARLG